MILLSSGDAILFRMIAAGACVGYFAASLAWRRSSHSSILMLWCMALLLESGSIALGAGGTWQPGAISEFGQLACLLLWILLE
jgi:hypothetical protein